MSNNSEKDFNQRVGTNSSVFTKGMHTHKIEGAMSFASDGEASFASKGTTYINGKDRINLNSGEASTIPLTVPPIPMVAHTDTLYDKTKGFAAAPCKLLSITSRAPAHAPWASACQGVDIEVELSADEALPPSPSEAVSQANATSNGASITIANDDIFQYSYLNNTNNNTYGAFAARYPGELGNSIKVSMWSASSNTSAFIGWDYFDEFNGLPGTSPWVSNRGGENDGMHIIVAFTMTNREVPVLPLLRQGVLKHDE